MLCSLEALVSLFNNVSTSFYLLFIFSYFTSILLAKLFHFLQRNEDIYEYTSFSDEEEEEEDDDNIYYNVKDHLAADIIHGGEEEEEVRTQNHRISDEGIIDYYDEPIIEELDECFGSAAQEFDHGGEDTNDDKELQSSPMVMNMKKSCLVVSDDETHEEKNYEDEAIKKKVETNFTRDENYLIFAPPKLETKKIQVEEKDNGEIFGDSCTEVGSTSKSSSEWRNSIKDSGTEDPFSSSSRRSCPKWESYTVFQKYDEEMLFLDRISAQKLHETESLRSIQACPRSISERIVHKLATRNKRSSSLNPYHDLESAYVAQICLTWEALNWNYKYFERLRASRSRYELNPGYPACVAQQFQQFQVLLQRYIETEPYERGRRPEVYARMRSLTPKLLQVPEYRDSDDEKREEGNSARISSNSFLQIMEDAIRTFMNFLKGERKNHSQILTSLFRRNQGGMRLLLLKKINEKKKLKLRDLRRSGNCLRKRKLKEEEEMEILMALIDLKVVSRVMKMTDLSEEQLQWCENKMNKVKVADGKLQRDSSPLFFPAH